MYASVRESEGRVKMSSVFPNSTRCPRWKNAVRWLTRAACCIELVTITTANVHDVLGAACVVCTRTSGAGFEALLHRTPVVLFARADYHHCAVRVKTPDETGAAIRTALTRDFPYEKYVWWFLRKGLFGVWHPAFDKRVSAAVLTSLGAGPGSADPDNLA